MSTVCWSALVVSCWLSPFAGEWASSRVQLRAAEGPELSRYFQELRQRGLFVVAEHFAWSRLQQPQLTAADRQQYAVELSRTLLEHAWYATPAQQPEFWDRAEQVLRDPTLPGKSSDTTPAVDPLNDTELLAVQRAFVQVARVQMLKWESIVAPEDRQRLAEFRRQAAVARSTLTAQITSLDARPAAARTDSPLSLFDRRQLAAGCRLELGNLLRWQAELTDPASAQNASAERASDLLDAIEAYQKASAATVDASTAVRSAIGLAECRRLQGDWDRARESVATATREHPDMSPRNRDELDAVLARCWLAAGQPIQAAEFLLKIRQSRHVLSGELWFVQLQTLLLLRDAARERQDRSLEENLQAEAELALTRVDEQIGGAWSRFCRQIWERDRSRQQLGAELDGVIREAKAAYLAQQPAESVALYARAISIARNDQLMPTVQELQYTRGSILLENGQFAAAAGQFQELADAKPPHAQTATANLLAAYAQGRLYLQEPTQQHRLSYTESLQRHLQHFTSDPTANDARWMLAQLEERRLQLSRALPLYYAVTEDHPRYLAATAAAARCSEVLLQRMRSVGRDSTVFQRETVAELSRRAQPWLQATRNWSEFQAELAIRLARIYLQGRPVNHAAALQLIQQFSAAAGELSRSSEGLPATWKPWADAAVPLRIVALAGTGKSQEARRLLEMASHNDPQASLALVTGLDELSHGPATTQFVDLTELLVSAVNQLEPQRDQLSPAEQRQFDLARTRVFLVTGRIPEGLQVLATLVQSSSRNSTQLQQLAELSVEVPDKRAQLQAQTIWRKIEEIEPPGSANWLRARAGVIDVYLNLKETAEAQKLLKLTRLLYPNLTDASQQQLYRDLATRLLAQQESARP